MNISPESIIKLRNWVDYNSTDMGELGHYIRVDYVHNGIDLILLGPAPITNHSDAATLQPGDL